eukprot:RCo012395
MKGNSVLWIVVLLGLLLSKQVSLTSDLPDELPLQRIQRFDKDDAFREAERLYQQGLTNFNGSASDSRDLRKALECFNSSARLGHAGAQFRMGLLYSHGLGVPRSEAMAVLYLTFAALGGDNDAQLSLASRHLYGHSVSKSCADSAKYYRMVAARVARSHKDSGIIAHVEKFRLTDDKALERRQTEEDVLQYHKYSADRGEVQSMMLLGRAYMYGALGMPQDAAQAEHYFRKAVQAGNPAGYGGLGTLYAQGVDGGPKPIARNYSKAMEYFKLGAEKGHYVSLNGMGFLYMGGYDVVKPDFAEAARYFKLAADQGNPEAQYNLGVLHLNGEGTEKDPQKAMHYLTLAAQQGQVLAHHQLGTIYHDGLANQPVNCPLAVKYYQGVAEKGFWMKMFEEAFEAYLGGDATTAFLLYTILAEQGFEIGQGNLAYLLDQQAGLRDLPVDLIFPLNGGLAANMTLQQKYRERALFWYTRSAEQGNADSIVKVGDYYYYGWGTEVDMPESVERYRDASNRGHAQAMFNLGYMHEFGKGVPRDFFLAKRYYDQAAATTDKAWAPVELALLQLRRSEERRCRERV